ncbi:MAG TPA: hypothetical protein VGQ18_14310 [Gemmatimonadales bacterium]|nr:hypothetical protein [Gemmatimonadales bacterium]
MLALLLQGASPTSVTVGRVTAVAWPGQETLATSLAEVADHAGGFPGIGQLPDRPLRLILAPTREKYDSLTRGRLPFWSEGAAFPDAGTIVLLTNHPAVGPSALRHELAHVALRWRLGRGGRVPLWFEEGYAAVAAEEWGRLDALRLNWQVARGMQMNLDQVDRALRGGKGDAETGYALATTAVLLLYRWGGKAGLDPLVANLAKAPTFDQALRDTYHVTEGDFEVRWQRDVASRYGWLSWAAAMGLFWAAMGAVLVALVVLRRRRDRARRATLDDGQLLDELDITP